jgi:hypothetical protein
MGELEKLITSTSDGAEKSSAKQEKNTSLAIVPLPEEEIIEGSLIRENAVNPLNPAYHVAGEMVDRMKGYLVKDPSDSKYQLARELVCAVKPNNGKLSDALIIEVGTLIAYTGISCGLDWIKNYFENKKK